MYSICLFLETQQPEWHNQWSYILNHFSPQNLYIVGNEDDIQRGYISFANAIQINHLSELPDTSLVLMQPVTAQHIIPDTNLIQFIHPDSCTYIFGADNSFMAQMCIDTCTIDHKVYIPTDNELEMYSWIAGALTLYDRKVKNG